MDRVFCSRPSPGTRNCSQGTARILRSRPAYIRRGLASRSERVRGTHQGCQGPSSSVGSACALWFGPDSWAAVTCSGVKGSRASDGGAPAASALWRSCAMLYRRSASRARSRATLASAPLLRCQAVNASSDAGAGRHLAGARRVRSVHSRSWAAAWEGSIKDQARSRTTVNRRETRSSAIAAGSVIGLPSRYRAIASRATV